MQFSLNPASNPQGMDDSFLVSKDGSQLERFNIGNARKLCYLTPSLATIQWQTFMYTGQP